MFDYQYNKDFDIAGFICDNYGDEKVALELDGLRFSIFNTKGVVKVLDYYVRNMEFHLKYSQTESDDYYTYKEQKKYLINELKEYKRGRMLPFFISYADNPGKVIGRISFFNFVYGGMMNCAVGYSLDKDECGKGIMTNGLRFLINYLFSISDIHRVEAFIVPDNKSSIKLIKRVGFKEEGLRIQYMNINGKWEDHKSFYFLREDL